MVHTRPVAVEFFLKTAPKSPEIVFFILAGWKEHAEGLVIDVVSPCDAKGLVDEVVSPGCGMGCGCEGGKDDWTGNGRGVLDAS